MMRFKGWAITAGLVLAATAANAQGLAPPDAGRPSYRSVSDFDGPGPYGAMPPPPPPGPPPVYNYGGYGPPLMPLQEVYAVLRDNGFSPLGVPHQRGMVYFIAAVDRGGNDGRLVIDARDGRILRFVPSYGYGGGPYGGYFRPERPPGYIPDRAPGYGPETSLPPPTVIRGIPRPPGPVPHVASRTVPLPSPKPAVAGGPSPAAPQQSAAIETKPAAAPTGAAAPPAPAHTSPPPSAQASVAPSPSTTTVGEAKPQAPIQPTQPMPAAQGLE
ncbi:MAG: hypothetical protein JO141_28925 [Bradyrhizobium sp.]|nr:hypothetical protein [Bradyrhizobium sp.]